MNPNMTLNTTPFKLIRPALASMRAMAMITLAATNLHKTEHRPLAAKVVAMSMKTDGLKNPTRQQMLTHLVAWHMVSKELVEAVKVSHPKIAEQIDLALMRTPWLKKIVEETGKVSA